MRIPGEEGARNVVEGLTAGGQLLLDSAAGAHDGNSAGPLSNEMGLKPALQCHSKFWS